MGCSQSQPSTAAVATSKDDPQAGLNKNKKREKEGSAGTESMGISTQHDNQNGTEDDNNDNNDNNSRDSTYYNEQDVMAPSTSLYGTVKHKASNKPTGTSSKDYLTLRYACVSQRGRDPEAKQKPNQDAYSIIVPPTDDNNVDNHFLFFGVYDGHGPQGERCAQFVQRKLPGLVQEKLDSVFLYDDEVHALKAAHLECNQLLRDSSINDHASGTTAISCYWHPNEPTITVCNVGDSRAILGSQRGNNSGRNNATTTAVMAVPLSKDQTPHRRDEANRCSQTGARILSFGQIDPRNMGKASHDEEDPPRVWHPTGMYPGTAFTRSLGDAVAESLGVIAEPEVLRLKLTPSEKVIVIASDGVFDVMSNQQVIDICMQHIQDDPIDACNAVIRESYKEWLKNEDCLDDEEAASYDDTTVCIIFIGEKEAKMPAFDKDSVPATLSPAPHPPVHQHHGKRVRQKTLRNLEEMAEQ